ncbi:MAG: GntR family transcriptional regulator [Burkholderiales bacterium RIFCSPLOWO2_02_FULL_57_36]|nr:MAG: GntR family transcriptional regulator [Burkholderiales bacterium RIFCSPLOWO2_02_FULL_57_36]
MTAKTSQANLLAEQLYGKLKDDIFNFRLLSGERFTESEMAQRYNVSRTPIRDALYRLEREGYLQVGFRSGWSVRPFDFERFEQLYDLRVILERAAVQSICEAEQAVDLSELQAIWLVPPEERLADGAQLSLLDEAFHQALVKATGNLEMTRVHREVTEKIRIIRHLDFTKDSRITATYEEHAQILRMLMQRKELQAGMLLKSHIETSKAEVRKITLHMLYTAREKLGLKSA